MQSFHRFWNVLRVCVVWVLIKKLEEKKVSWNLIFAVRTLEVGSVGRSVGSKNGNMVPVLFRRQEVRAVDLILKLRDLKIFMH